MQFPQTTKDKENDKNSETGQNPKNEVQLAKSKLSHARRETARDVKLREREYHRLEAVVDGVEVVLLRRVGCDPEVPREEGETRIG